MITLNRRRLTKLIIVAATPNGKRSLRLTVDAVDITPVVTGELALVPVEAMGTGLDTGHHWVALVAKATLDKQGAVAGVGVVPDSVLELATVAQICVEQETGSERLYFG